MIHYVHNESADRPKMSSSINRVVPVNNAFTHVSLTFSFICDSRVNQTPSEDASELGLDRRD